MLGGEMRRGTLKLLPIGLVAVLILFQFLSAEKFINPETGEKHRVGMSERQEAVLGLQSYQQVLQQSDTVDSGPEYELVRRVAQRLAAATGSSAKNFDWQVSLIRNEQVNAFCLPGGKIVVFTGILPVCRTEAGLAAVMGHEMAHATSRHGSQRVFQQNIAQTALLGAQMSLSDMSYEQQRAIMGALGVGAQYGVLMPFGREHENEADYIGLLYMARAGYDPHEAVDFWERMSKAGGDQPPEFLSTHPSHGTRIERLRQNLPKAMAEYEKARAGGVM
jgi:predicted Zn-dependent protease